MAVVTAFEFDGQVPAGEAARDAQGTHRGFGSRVDQTHHFNGWETLGDQLGQLYLASGGSTEAGADFQDLSQRVDQKLRPVAQDQRSPGADVIDVLVVVDVVEPGAFAARDEGRRTADAAKRPNGGVDSTRNQLLRPRKQSFGPGMIQASPAFSTVTNFRRKKFITTSGIVPFTFLRNRLFSPR